MLIDNAQHDRQGRNANAHRTVTLMTQTHVDYTQRDTLAAHQQDDKVTTSFFFISGAAVYDEMVDLVITVLVFIKM